MLRKLILMALITAPMLLAQKTPSETNAGGKEAQPAGGRIRDERVDVEHVSFWKKFAADGKGEYLEFTFDIVNKTEDDVPLKMFIIGFNEKDLVDAQYRRYVEYPKWRVFDEDKRLHAIVLMDSIPAFDAAKQSEVAAFAKDKEKKAADIGQYKVTEKPEPVKGKVTLQDFLRYVQFIHEKPDTGTDVLLQGFENAKFTRKAEGSYRLEEKALRVNVWGKLLSKYRVDRKFFNHFGIVLYDTKAQKFVHRQFYSINGPFKIY